MAKPGQVRDAILAFLSEVGRDASVAEIEAAVRTRVPEDVGSSSIRSYLRLNTPDTFVRSNRGRYRLHEASSNGEPWLFHTQRAQDAVPAFEINNASMFEADCLQWLANQSPNSIHAVVTDPPYGLVEYSRAQQEKLRNGRGGVWRIPPAFDGAERAPVPRFTVLRKEDHAALRQFFRGWAAALLPVLVPGANVIVASQPLLSCIVSTALGEAGFERRGEIIRLVMTMRGGDRPKNAHEEFPDVSVMPRSMWEPWLMFRKPLEGRVQDNLRRWKTGGFRRPSAERPFGDVIKSSPTPKREKQLAPHPSLKPQAFLRQVVRAALPLGEGVVLDPFAGSGSTLAACKAVGYRGIGVEQDPAFIRLAREAVPKLAALLA